MGKLLTEKQFESAREFFAKLKGGSCPMCRENAWQVLSSGVVLEGFKLPNIIMREEGYKIIGICCKKCGHISLHLAEAVLPEDFKDA